jgi:hypothetical protein
MPTIIALMEGIGQLFCGFSMVLIPGIGVINMHYAASIYCGLAAILLLI